MEPAMTLRAYIALAVLLAFMGLGGVALYYRAEAADAAKEAQQAISDRDTAIAANTALQGTVNRLRAAYDRNDKLTAELEQKLADAKVAVLERKDALTALKETDATVLDYLKSPVPLSLRRLYDR
jgi:LysB family phage lysis regulatory protein